MQLSMWLIARKMGEFDISCDIKSGRLCIEGVRFMSDEKYNDFEDRYVYLCEKHETYKSGGAHRGITLINGQDIILVRNESIPDVLNSLLAAFEYYNSWERRMLELPRDSDIQTVLDCGGQVLGNPVVISGIDGSVAAMSREYLEYDLNENWVFCREHGRLPAKILGMPQKNSRNLPAEWSAEPQILILPDGTRTAAAMIGSSNGYAAAISMWEYESRIDAGSLQLMEKLCRTISSLDVVKGKDNRRRRESLLKKLLEEDKDFNLPDSFEVPVGRPWRMISIRNLGNSNEVGKKGILRYLEESGIANISFEFGGEIICLVNSEDHERIIAAALGTLSPEYYLVCVSEEFSSILVLRTRFEQNVFCMKNNSTGSGVIYSKNRNLDYMTYAIRKNTDIEPLIHPAVPALAEHDAENGTDLYASLFYYLLYERSICRAAEAVHIHRNSFLYRIKKITGMTGVCLDDAEERSRLLISFMLYGRPSGR